MSWTIKRQHAKSPGAFRRHRCLDPSGRALSRHQSSFHPEHPAVTKGDQGTGGATLKYFRIGLFGELERVAVGQIRVTRRHCEDDGVGVRDEAHAHAADLLLNIQRLVAH